ncbi:MAG: lysylphosphatidylglycerol synthase domain-containing protein, partial [Solimonas sp.]
MPSPSRLRSTLITLAVALAYVAAVEWLCGWRRLLGAWSELPPWLLPAFLTAMLASYLLRAWRLYRGAADIPRGHYFSTLRLLWLHNAANLLLPARLGEFALPWLLRRRHGIPWTAGGGLLLWLRLLDLHCVAALGAVALGQRLATLSAAWTGLWLAAASAIAVLPLLLYATRRPLAARAGQQRWAAALAAIPARLPDLLRELALTWLAWLAKLGAFVLVLRALADAA